MVTEDQVKVIQEDFNNLLDDITELVPNDDRLEMAVMGFKMSEQIIINLLRKHIHKD